MDYYYFFFLLQFFNGFANREIRKSSKTKRSSLPIPPSRNEAKKLN